MTWSISASGPKEEVEQKLEGLDTPNFSDDQEAGDFENALTYSLLQIANAAHSVSVSASGYRNTDGFSASVSISQWKPAPTAGPT